MSPGSATEMKKPRIKPAIRTIQSLLLLATAVPVRLPKGVIPISTPNKNSVKPSINRREPSKKLISWAVLNGTSVKCNKSTIITIGRTEKTTPLILVAIKLKLSPLYL